MNFIAQHLTEHDIAALAAHYGTPFEGE